MKKSFLMAIMSWATFAVAIMPAFAEGDANAGKAKAGVCAACHMMDGNSLAPTFPKIAGQSASYILKQLKDFKAKQRSDLDGLGMAPQAQALNEQDMENLAAYFSRQTVNPGSSSRPDLLPKGKEVYLKGNIKERVTACVGCHGPAGKGYLPLEIGDMIMKSVVEAPALGGQHAAYIVKQLNAFQNGDRSNDIGKVMRNISAGMTKEEIEAVAEYIATLN